MQNKGSLGAEYNLYNINTEEFNINLDEIFSVYRHVYEVADTEVFRLKKLLANSLSKVTTLTTESSSIKSLYASIFNLFNTTREFGQYFPAEHKLTKTQQDAISINGKFQETISAIVSDQNKTINQRSQALLHIMPALEAFMRIIQKISEIVTEVNPKCANQYSLILQNLREIGKTVSDNYRQLQQQRFTPQGKKDFWIDVWDDAHETLYKFNCCAPLEEVKSLSNYWYFLLDEQHTVRVRRASMPKFAHLADQPEELSKYIYKDNVPPQIDFNQLTNRVVFDTDEDLEFINLEEINAYIARQNSPDKLIEMLADLLLDSDLEFIMSRIDAQQRSLKKTIEKLQNINARSALISMQALRNALHSSCDFSNENMSNLCELFNSLNLDNKNLLLIEAVQNNIAMWVGIFLENNASLSAKDQDGDDVLLVALKATPSTRGKVLDKILTLSSEQLQELPSLKSDTVANFIYPSTQNTLLHEVALRKKTSLAFFQYYCQMDLKRPIGCIFLLKNKKQEPLVDLIKDTKLKELIKRHQRQIFYRALCNNNLVLVNLYLNCGGNANTIVNRQHPLAIVWQNLKETDENVIDILYNLLQNGANISTPVDKEMGIYDATCQTLSARSVQRRFFTDTQDNYRSALCVLTEFRQHNQQQNLLELLKDSIILNWLTYNMQQDLLNISEKCINLFFCKLLFQGEVSKSCVFLLALILATSLLNNLSPEKQIDSIHTQKKDSDDTDGKYTSNLLSNRLSCV